MYGGDGGISADLLVFEDVQFTYVRMIEVIVVIYVVIVINLNNPLSDYSHIPLRTSEVIAPIERKVLTSKYVEEKSRHEP